MGKMAEMQRKLLEQMMGPEAMGLTIVNYNWWDDKVCKNFLFGTCPHIVFSNTRMDLGPCPKVHSEKLIKEFREAQAAPHPDPRIAVYRQEHENALYGFIEECDRRIRASQRKLEKTPEENRKTVDLMREIGEIELSIQGGTEEVEALGEAGKVEESMDKLQAVEALKGLKTEKERELQQLNETAGASGHQKLRVCETCGAMLSVLDSDKRLADHFGGKLHLGYHELRKLLGEIAELRMSGRPYLGVGVNPPPSNAAPPPPAPAPAAPSAPSGPRSNAPPVPPFAPSGPSAPAFENSSNGTPHTPHHSRVPPAEEMPHVGHGDKVKREAGELEEDVRDSRGERERDERRHRERERERDDKYERRDRDRERDREDRYSSRDDKHDKYERSSRHEERDRSDRDRERERRDGHRDRDYERSSSKYDDEGRSSRHREREREAERSRSPAKRRLV